MLTLRHIFVLEIRYYLYARSINERLHSEYKIVQLQQYLSLPGVEIYPPRRNRDLLITTTIETIGLTRL